MLEQDERSAGPVALEPEVIEALTKLQFAANTSNHARIRGRPKTLEPVIFEAITAETIAKAAVRTRGAHGPSGGDADNWKRQLTSFEAASTGLCDAIAAATRRLCSFAADPATLEALLGSRLLPFRKNPKENPPEEGDPQPEAPPPTDIRPIGIGEVLRRIIGKAVMTTLRKDISQAAGTLNLCTGQKAGCETIFHLVSELFSLDETDGLLLIDG